MGKQINFGDERLPQRFWDKCMPEPNSGCWLWLTPKNNGYGGCRLDGSQRLAHRISYTALVGAIPDGMQLDHLCRVRCCVNPAHLEAVTHRENTLRGVGPSAQHAAKTHCHRGHEFTDENTRIVQRSKGRPSRSCRMCDGIRSASYYARQP